MRNSSYSATLGRGKILSGDESGGDRCGRPSKESPTPPLRSPQGQDPENLGEETMPQEHEISDSADSVGENNSAISKKPKKNKPLDPEI